MLAATEGEALATRSGILSSPAGEPVLPPDAVYSDGWAELRDQLTLLRLRVRHAVDRFRRIRPQSPQSGMASTVIFDDEVDLILSDEESVQPVGGATRDPLGQALHLKQYARRLTIIRDATPEKTVLPLRRLARRFTLSPIELEVLVLCLAPLVQPGLARVYGYLQDDVNRTAPSLALVLEIHGQDWRERIALRRQLHAGLPLFRHRLVRAAAGSTVGDDVLTVDPHVARHLLEALEGDPAAAPSRLSARLDALLLPEKVHADVRGLAKALAEGGRWLVSLHAAPQSGKTEIAQALAAAAGRGLEHWVAADGDTGATRIAEWLRDAYLADRWPSCDLGQLPEDKAARLADEIAAQASREAFGALFLLTTSDRRPLIDGSLVRQVAIDVPLPPPPVRHAAWARFLEADHIQVDEGQLDMLARGFPMTAGQIHRAVAEVAARAGFSDGARIDTAALRRSALSQTRHQLDRLAQHVPPVHGWNDVVLPPEQMRQLREITQAIRNRQQVLEGWRFGEKVSTSPGISILFFGPSGTGKTMCAGILASDIGMDLHRVDLSRVVSKYIGETEKNLEALFLEARRACTVLFFDEADALFGKRSDVRDAHDRYANIEVAYLLQRMESHEGVTILATNLRRNVDAAFMRRLQFSVEFVAPDVEQRLLIWRQVWPPAAPLGPDVDLPFLARQFELAGGSIRNVALKAAYLAASDERPIGMADLMLAIRREFQKVGRLCVDDAFGEYRSLATTMEAR